MRASTVDIIFALTNPRGPILDHPVYLEEHPKGPSLDEKNTVNFKLEPPTLSTTDYSTKMGKVMREASDIMLKRPGAIHFEDCFEAAVKS